MLQAIICLLFFVCCFLFVILSVSEESAGLFFTNFLKLFLKFPQIKAQFSDPSSKFPSLSQSHPQS